MDKKIYYAGIGSRKTPIEILMEMEEIASRLSENYILRSGGAPGADSAFENGCNGEKEIFLPWKNFNGNKSKLIFEISDIISAIAKQFHPKWKRLPFSSKCLIGRNVHQILGKDLQTPSKFVICWTNKGQAVGGTGFALRIAESRNIPIYNLSSDKKEDILEEISRLSE